MDTNHALARRLITAAVMVVGIYDVVVGAIMLGSSTPWWAHGPGTSWITLGATIEAALPPDATLGLFRRMGAFSLHAGVCTIVWAALGHREPRLMSALFITYAITGMGFAITDATYFDGTPYLLGKRVIGAVFFAALLGHFWLRTRARAANR
jgi:hypothetical protein